LLGDIVRAAITSQADMELLPDIPRDDSRDWRRPEPDVIVLSTSNIDNVSGISDCLNRWPRARIVAIEVSGRQTMMYELRPHAAPLGALSPEQLLATIRHEDD
jgi:hypothetical protein